jgi:hypothetical protein
MKRLKLRKHDGGDGSGGGRHLTGGDTSGGGKSLKTDPGGSGGGPQAVLVISKNS